MDEDRGRVPADPLSGIGPDWSGGALGGQLGRRNSITRSAPSAKVGAATGGVTVRQLDRVSQEVLSRAWVARAGPGDTPLTAGRMDGGSHQEKETPSPETFPPSNH